MKIINLVNFCETKFIVKRTLSNQNYHISVFRFKGKQHVAVKIVLAFKIVY